MKITQLVATSLVGFLMLAGCQRTPTAPDEVEEALVVNMLLRPNLAATAVITRNLPADDFGQIYVNDADAYLNGVRMENIPKETTLHEQRDFIYLDALGEGAFNYITRGMSINPGQRYTLFLTTPRGDTVRGETLVPPELTDFRFENETSRVSWINPSGITLNMIRILSPGNETLDGPYFKENRTPLFAMPIAREVFENDHNYYICLIQSFDQNYYNYFFNDDLSAGLEGALGVMGAITRNAEIFIP